MRSYACRHQYTYAQYVALEQASNVKHEFYGGEIYAMAGGTPEHAALAGAVITALSNQLQGRPCRVFSSDLRVRVQSTGLATYPDVTVVCGPLERDPQDQITVLNPTLLVEVLSPSTEAYDRGEKLEHYCQIPSLQDCMLLSHREPLIEVWSRQDDGDFERHVGSRGSTVAVPSTDGSLDVDAIYGDILVPSQ